MAYIDENLLPGEKIIYRAHLHWIVFLKPAFLLIIASILGLALRNAFHALLPALICWALGLVPAMASLIVYLTSEFGVTNKRVLVKVGLIARSSLEILLSKVESIQVNQGLLGRIFDYGSIVVSGTGGSQDPLHNISCPLRFRRMAQEQIAAAQDFK